MEKLFISGNKKRPGERGPLGPLSGSRWTSNPVVAPLWYHAACLVTSVLQRWHRTSRIDPSFRSARATNPPHFGQRTSTRRTVTVRGSTVCCIVHRQSSRYPVSQVPAAIEVANRLPVLPRVHESRFRPRLAVSAGLVAVFECLLLAEGWAGHSSSPSSSIGSNRMP